MGRAGFLKSGAMRCKCDPIPRNIKRYTFPTFLTTAFSRPNTNTHIHTHLLSSLSLLSPDPNLLFFFSTVQLRLHLYSLLAAPLNWPTLPRKNATQTDSIISFAPLSSRRISSSSSTIISFFRDDLVTAFRVQDSINPPCEYRMK